MIKLSKSRNEGPLIHNVEDAELRTLYVVSVISEFHRSDVRAKRVRDNLTPVPMHLGVW
jgi:hypothetical protein